MNKGRRKIVKGLMLALIGVFVLTQPVWAETFSGTNLEMPQGYSQWSGADKVAYLKRLNQDGTLSSETLQVLEAQVVVEDPDTITISIVRLIGKIINNVFVVTKQLVNFSTTDNIAHTRVIGNQETSFTVDTLGRTQGATGKGSQTSVDALGYLGLGLGDFEIDEEAARVVTDSTSKTVFRVIFGSPTAVGITQDSTTTDELNMQQQKSHQVISYDVNDNGQYLGGTGDISGTSRNLNFKKDADGNITQELVVGSEVVTTTEGTILFGVAAAVNEVVATDTETISLTRNRLTNELVATAQDSHTDYDAFGAIVKDADGVLQSSAKTYSLSLSTRQGNVTMAQLTAEGTTELLVGTEKLKEIGGVDADGNPLNIEGTAQDVLVENLAGDRVDQYTVSVGRVTFGLLSRNGDLLATEQTQDSRSRDTSTGGRTQSDSNTVITINYTADLSGRIASQNGAGTGAVKRLNTDGTIDTTSDFASFNETTLNFIVDTLNNQALIESQTTISGERDGLGSQVLSSQTTFFNYDETGALKAEGTYAIQRSSSMTLRDLDGDGPGTAMDGDPTIGTHTESVTVIDFMVLGNQAVQKSVRTVSITDDHADGDPATGLGTRSVNVSELVYQYDMASGAGRVIGATSTPRRTIQTPGIPEGNPIDDGDLIAEYAAPPVQHEDGSFSGGFGVAPPPVPPLPTELDFNW